MGPWKPCVATLRVIFPSAPALMTLSYSGTVQPQDGFTSVMWRSDFPSFLIEKTPLIVSPFGTVPTSILSLFRKSFGPLGSTLAAGAGAAGALVAGAAAGGTGFFSSGLLGVEGVSPTATEASVAPA